METPENIHQEVQGNSTSTNGEERNGEASATI